ncbi:MAG: ribonuclease D, partial [Microbacteriaceae bacterium]
ETGMTTQELPALRAGSDTIPPPRAWADRNPQAHRRLTLARAGVGQVSAELELPLENLLKPSLLRQLAWNPPQPLALSSIESVLHSMGARPWQIEATAQSILEGFVEASQVVPEPEEAPS